MLVESFAGRRVELGDLAVTRVLPLRGRRMVGPWCFVDRFGPLTFAAGNPMDVAPHPHIGLQTVTWLLDGEIRHDDSLGCSTVTRPGGVSVMTAGRGIAHSEQTPEVNSRRLDGVQLWVALEEAARHRAPDFAAVSQVPEIGLAGGAIVRIFAGSALGAVSAAPHFSPILGLDLAFPGAGACELPVDAGWEHAAVILHGEVSLEGTALGGHRLHYMGTSRGSLALSSHGAARLLILGGPPFSEKILMWWNFVARTHEEIRSAREEWERKHQERFGDVKAYQGARLPAPELAGYTLGMTYGAR